MARKLIYCDESGEASFSKTSAYDYFVVCAITIDESIKNKMRNTIRRKKRKLYRLGWPKPLEIKASVLHTMEANPEIPDRVKDTFNGDEFIKEILTGLRRACSPRVDYIVVKKDCVRSPALRNASYGIAYNYFAGEILIPLVCHCRNCLLTVDRRNKEVHSHRHFDGYIETTLYRKAFEEQLSLDFDINHEESHKNYGLQAVDFFTWSVYRAKSRRDTRFLEVFKDLVENKEEMVLLGRKKEKCCNLRRLRHTQLMSIRALLK